MDQTLLFILEIVAALGLIVVLIRESKRTQYAIQGDLQAMRKLLHETTSVMHEFRRFKTAFDRSYDAMVITDVDGKILYVNDSVLRINGYARRDVLGTKAGKLWGGLMGKKFYKDMWHQIKVVGEPYVGQIINRRKNGDRYTAAITISPLFDDSSSKPIGFVAVERDLTEKNFTVPVDASLAGKKKR